MKQVYLWVIIFIALVIVGAVMSGKALAATLLWDAQTVASPLIVERSASQTGPFTTVATLPTGATSYVLTPGAYGWYRVTNGAGPSNAVQFSLDLYTGPVTTRLDALERRVDAITTGGVTTSVPTVPPASNFTVTVIDADHVRLVCNGVGITTSGSGTSRILECRH